MGNRRKVSKGAEASADAPLPIQQVSASEADKLAGSIIASGKIDYVYSIKEDGAMVEKKGSYNRSDLEDSIEAFVNKFPACQVKWKDDVLLVCNKYTNSLKTINVRYPLDVVKTKLNAAHGSMFDLGVDLGGIEKAQAMAYARAESPNQVKAEAQRILQYNVGDGYGYFARQFEQSPGKLYQA